MHASKNPVIPYSRLLEFAATHRACTCTIVFLPLVLERIVLSVRSLECACSLPDASVVSSPNKERSGFQRNRFLFERRCKDLQGNTYFAGGSLDGYRRIRCHSRGYAATISFVTHVHLPMRKIHLRRTLDVSASSPMRRVARNL